MLLMRIDRAGAGDEATIEALLRRASLPTDGAARAFEHGVVARDGNRLVGAAAVEIYGAAGLMRSVVVDEHDRGTGSRRDLVLAAEKVARDSGVRELYLLTETAMGWFPRPGYVPVDREAARAAVGRSIEFTLSCATTGVALRRNLD
jgi:amino-acid N-acetyltransferase